MSSATPSPTKQADLDDLVARGGQGRLAACPDRQQPRAARGVSEETGPGPVDRRKKGSKHHVITDAGGVPLVAQTAANVPNVKPMIEPVDAIPTVRGKLGRPRRRPKSLYCPESKILGS